MSKRLNFAAIVTGKHKHQPQEATKPIDFEGFRLAHRPDIIYTGGYSYLREPIAQLLSGRDCVFMKGSQVGVTELMLSFTLYWLVVEQANVFYMLPTSDEVGTFSAARFNPVIEESESLKSNFTYDNVHHKRVGRANLYLRGGQAPGGKPSSKVKQVAVSKLVLDELDEIPEETLAIVNERLSGSLEKQVVKMSTPTDAARGIAKEYYAATAHEYLLDCVHCTRPQPLTLENLDIEGGVYFCIACKKPWTHPEKIGMIAAGRWSPVESEKPPASSALAYHIPQLLSPTVTAGEVAQAQLAATDELQKQAFMNHKLGLPYTAEGSKLSIDHVAACVFDWDQTADIRIAGMDVSSTGLHYLVIAESFDPGPVVRKIMRVSWADLLDTLRRERVGCVVIDYQPERSKASEFLTSFGTGAFAALYPQGLQTLYTVAQEAKVVKIHRTQAIDRVLDRFREQRILFTPELAATSDFKVLSSHVTAVSRKYRESRGVYEAYYVEQGADHYLHALVYAEIAAELAGAFCPPEFDVVSGNFLGEYDARRAARRLNW